MLIAQPSEKQGQMNCSTILQACRKRVWEYCITRAHQESAHFALRLRLSGLNIYELLNSHLPVQYHGSSASAACRVLTVRIECNCT
jgi:hypothetical protein